MVSSAPATTKPAQVLAGNGARPNRLSSSSRFTTQQKAFAQLIAAGLDSAASAYRKAYNRKSNEMWARVAAYDLARKPHVAAEIARLKAEYDAARPSLTRSSKREILHGMAVSDELDPQDRQRAIDIDNRMQGEYQERMHLTQEVSISLFRGNGAGQTAVQWQLAENMPQLVQQQEQAQLGAGSSGPVIDVQASAVSEPLLATAQPEPPLPAVSSAAPCPAEAAASSPLAQSMPALGQPLQRAGKRRNPPARNQAKPLTTEQLQALRVLPAERLAARKRAKPSA